MKELLMRLSCLLSDRFNRSITSLNISVQQTTGSMMFGTFGPSYSFTVYTLAKDLQPTTSKRNVALVQKRIHELLGIHPDRGVVLFIPIKPEHAGYDGQTLAGVVDKLEGKKARLRQTPQLDAEKTSTSTPVLPASQEAETSRQVSRTREPRLKRRLSMVSLVPRLSLP